MKTTDTLQSFIEICGQKDVSVDSLATAFRKAIERLGFRYFACLSHVDPVHPPAHAIMLHNYPAAWVRRFSEQKLYAIDPVLRRAEREEEPFFWDRAFRTSLTLPQRKMLADAASLGIAHGFTFPVHPMASPSPLPASCSIVPGSARVGLGNYFVAEGLANHLVSVLGRIRVAHEPIATCNLSHRERQCVLLIAQGKTDAEVASALGMMKSTAHTYIERLKMRLGVKSRTAAVARALITGQISPHDLPAPRR